MARILIADDDADERDLIIFALRFAGHKVFTAADGKGGYSLANEPRPDLILLDSGLFQGDGPETWSEVVRDRKGAGIPVILLVDEGQGTDIEAGLDVARLDFFLRPISPDRLTKKVNDTLKTAWR